MADREKVIKGLDICLKNIDSPDCPSNCPYYSDCSKYENRVVFQPLMRDALELLKEQEPIAPVVVSHSRGIAYNCGVCGTEIAVIRDTVSAGWAKENVRYCQRCGRAVKWDAD